MDRPGDYLPDATEGITRVEDLPPPHIERRRRNSRRRTCPRCGYSASLGSWTIVRPPRLTDKPATGRYRTAFNLSVRRGYTLSRADLAGAILKLLDDPRAIHAAVGIGY